MNECDLNILYLTVVGAIALAPLYIKFFFDKRFERYKTRLRISEFLFQKEFEAASAFISLRQQLSPRYRFPDMDWYDACEDFARNFKQVENTLGSYIAVHGAALESETLKKRLTNAKERASEGQIEVDCYGNVSVEGTEIADEVMDALKKVEEELYQTIRSQSDT